MWRSFLERMEYARSDARELEEQDFLMRYPAPVLIAREITGGMIQRKKLLSSPGPRKKRKAPSTMVHFIPSEIPFDLDDPEILLDRRFSRECYVLLKSNKAMRGEAPVQLGRTSEADVLINDFTVSTVHAQVSYDTRLRRYVISDKNSTNGTKVAGKAIPGQEAVPLESGQKIHFGRLGFVFLEPLDFYAYLRGELENQRLIQALLDRED